MSRPEPDGVDNGSTPLRRFVRDVGVNVVANLITAAVIYVVGVATGLLPRVTPAIWGAIATLLLGGFYLIFVVAQFQPEERKFRLYGIGFMLAGPGYALGAALGVTGPQIFPGADWVLAAGLLLLGTLFALPSPKASTRDQQPARVTGADGA